MCTLHIYIIEDDIKKKDRMEAYFQMINSALTSGNKDSELVKLLENKGIKNVDCQVILPIPESKQDERYEYHCEEGSEFAKKIKSILEREEKRVFFIDLALNAEECDIFSRSLRAFRAHTASAICKIIVRNEKEEAVILNTRFINVKGNWKRLLNIDNEHQKFLKVESIPADTFTVSKPNLQRDILICEAMESCL